MPFWFIAAHVPAVIQERRALTRLAPGCYRVGPDWLESLPMSTATYEELRAIYHVGERTDDPDRRMRQRILLGWFLDALPEEREKLKDEGKLQEARAALRTVLHARRLTLAAEDQARIDCCDDHDTLSRWLEQAAVATTVADALR